MKRVSWPAISAITVLLGINFGNLSVGHSQPTILIAPELKPFPPEPMPPYSPTLPKPPKLTPDDLRAMGKPPFRIPKEFELRECLSSCNKDFCLLCTKPVSQLEAGWCWNAVSQMVLNYHGVPDEQCRIADRVYPQQSPCCLNDGRPDPGNNCGLTLGGFPQYVFATYEFNYSPPDNPNTGDPQVQILYWNSARKQILATRPYIAWMRSTDEWDHTLVVHGFTTDSSGVRKLKVVDPQQNPPDDWWQPWDSQSYLGNATNTHRGDIADIEPKP